MAKVIAFVVVGGYFAFGYGLLAYVVFLRARRPHPEALPHPLAFVGPSIWAYVFSSRHRRADDPILTTLVFALRTTMVLMPLGIWAFFAVAASA